MSRIDRLVTAWLLMACTLTCSAASAGKDHALPCAEEIEQYCGQVTVGDGKILRCLDQHRPQLSAGCEAKLRQLETRRQEIRQHCAADAGKYCGHLQPGKGRVVKCLTEHRAELSTACAVRLGGKLP